MEINTKPVQKTINEDRSAIDASDTAKESTSQMSLFRVDGIPSGRKPYPELNVLIRPYTWAEQKAMASSTRFSDIYRIAKKGIDSSVPVDDLVVGDFMWFALLRKLYSFPNSEFTATTSCRKCKSKIKRDVKLKDLEFSEMKAPSCPATIVDPSGREMKIYPVRMGDFVREVEKENDEVDFEFRIISTMFREVPQKEAIDYLMSADSEFGEIIEDLATKYDCSLMPLEFVCPECGERNMVTLDLMGRGVILTPFHGTEKSSRYSVSFGV